MSLKLKDTNSLTYLGWPSGVAGVWPGPAKPGTAYPSAFSQEEELPPGLLDPANLKKKRRPANLCIECPVCGAPAPDHLHFGGQCCYSCRAFFRRTSSRPVSSFRCRSGSNNCVITSGCKTCIPCRLARCLQIGMDPGLVRGRKVKSYEDCYSDFLQEPLPPLTPIKEQLPLPSNEETALQVRAKVLKYQGLCLRYQASLLENQAKNISQHKPARPADMFHAYRTPAQDSKYSLEGQDQFSKMAQQSFSGDNIGYPSGGFSAGQTLVPRSKSVISGRERASPRLLEEDPESCGASFPLDLSLKRITPPPSLHTQAVNMPRIFFRTDQNTNREVKSEPQ